MARMVVDLRVTGCWRHRVGEHHGRAKFADSLVDQVLELHERGLSQRADFPIVSPTPEDESEGGNAD